MSAAAPLQLTVEAQKWPLEAAFRITGYTFFELDFVVVTLRQGNHVGRGEAAGVYYRDDDAAHIMQLIESVRAAVESGITRDALQDLLPAGGARNALDCALWDLDAKRTGRPVWQLAGLDPPVPRLTTFTLPADDPERLAAGARAYALANAIKIKLTGERADAERVRAVRAARPDVWLSVDANQGFTRNSLEQLMPVLVDADVKLIEQPFRIGREADLEGLHSTIPIAADESVQEARDIESLVGLVDVINIKLDKSGGLTEALAMARVARRHGLRVMVGNMTGTSLAMAPAFIVAQLCDFADLDGPIFLRSDRTPAVSYDGGAVWCAPQLWGSP